jgi:hypothetical protein
VGPLHEERARNIEASSLARPGGVLESDRLPADMHNHAMDAVEGFNHCFTAGDVVSTADM